MKIKYSLFLNSDCGLVVHKNCNSDGMLPCVPIPEETTNSYRNLVVPKNCE